MSVGSWHKCPGCGRDHRALTDLCYRCKRRNKDYELAFELERDRIKFDETMARIRHEEKILRSKGLDPNSCPAARADKILCYGG